MFWLVGKHWRREAGAQELHVCFCRSRNVYTPQAGAETMDAAVDTTLTSRSAHCHVENDSDVLLRRVETHSLS